ncbi:hypothetical protein T11_6455 [Trichinella zimbabwensis]|uniref:Uncharacterized protein n=1 Tax=Trichinella zimbabwensis TaxID=268475 RepID=A0A0V1HUZ3_9BILA|nr:hypothetical protein T11_6455 [Trichinella zimbabwensis]
MIMNFTIKTLSYFKMSDLSLLRTLMLTAVFFQVASRVALADVSRVIEKNGSTMVMFHGKFSNQMHHDGRNDHHVNATNDPLKSISSDFVESDGKEAVDANLTASANDASTVVTCIQTVNFTAEHYDINENSKNTTQCKTKSNYKLCELLIVTASGLSITVIITIACYLQCFKIFKKRIRARDTEGGEKSKNPGKGRHSLCNTGMESETGDVAKGAN